jgi:hypothetical protein
MPPVLRRTDGRKVRVLLAEMAPMLQEMLSRLLSVEPDLEPFAEDGDRRQVLRQVRRLQPDVLLLGSGDETLGDFEPSLFQAHPWLKILAIEPTGRQFFLHELRPHRSPLGEVSPQRLLDVIRTAMPPVA